MQRPDWRGAAQAIEASAPGARAYVVPRNGDEAISYYLGLDRLRQGGPSHLRTAVIPVLSTNYRVQRPPGPFRLTDQQRLAPSSSSGAMPRISHDACGCGTSRATRC